MILSDNLTRVHSDIRGDIYMHALELEKAGRKVLKLNTGNPAAFGFKMPESIKSRIITIPASETMVDCSSLPALLIIWQTTVIIIEIPATLRIRSTSIFPLLFLI